VVATPVLLTGGETTGPLRTLLDAVSDYFAPLGDGGAPRSAPALQLVVPLQRKSGTPLGVIVLRKLELAVSYHETRISEADLPFVELVRTRVESDVDNVLLYRELEAFAAGLERKVAERTAQLVEASKRAAILTLVAGLSHELNNPIGVILGYAQGLLASATEPLAKRQLAAIERQALRCGQLVKALLSFAENRPMALDIIPPAILLQGVAASVEREAAQRGVTVLVDLPDEDLPSLLVSAESMRETVQQLVMNALDATPAGGTVTLHASEKAQNAVAGVELTVRDTGSGIPHAFLARIFDPFFTTKPPGKGVGLGLSLARRTVESHGGTIGVRSTIGAGTTVVIWLPVAVADDRDEPQRTAEGGR
jgi:signal transduction histidine kinase